MALPDLVTSSFSSRGRYVNNPEPQSVLVAMTAPLPLTGKRQRGGDWWWGGPPAGCKFKINPGIRAVAGIER